MNTKMKLVSAFTATAVAVMVGGAALGQAQDRNQQRCINAINKDAAKVAAAQGKLSSGCVRTGTAGSVAPACPTTDTRNTLETAKNKTGTDEMKNCLGGDLPTFGYTGSSTATGAAISNELALLSDTYGSTDLSSVISTNNTIGRCQSAVTRDVEKVAVNVQKDYIGCKKKTLRSGASGASALEACVNQDSSQRTHRSIIKLQGDVMNKCTDVGVNQASAFPGDCISASDLGACLGAKAVCEMCQAINAEDGIHADCCSTCPLKPGRYIETTTGGLIHTTTFAPFPFPSGGTIIQDVSVGDANCVHHTVVPYPGGLIMPLYCVPALAATVQVTQAACGVGEIDSDGGSDFTVTENGDTSETPICNVHQPSCPSAGPAPDSFGRIDITVGDGAADTCTTGGTANAILSIPVQSIDWIAADTSCPDTDGMYNPGTDTLLDMARLPQTLDLTTDKSTAQFVDLDGDGCKKSGLGPSGPYSSTGTCIDIGATTVSMAASGMSFWSGSPTYDTLFTMVQNATISGPEPSGGATCSSPPAINFGGLAHRCIVAP